MHALGEHRQALVDHEADDARGVEAAAVVDHDRRLLDLLDDVVGLGQRRVGGLLALDDLDQRHLVDRREEVQADEVLGPVHAGRELGDRQRRGVGAEQRVRVDVRQRSRRTPSALSAGSSKTASMTRSQPARSAGSAVAVIRPSSSAFFSSVELAARDRLVEQLLGVGLALLGVLGGDVLEDDLHAGAGADVGDAGAHHPGAEDTDLGRLLRLDALRAELAGVDRLQVEEERLDHVLRALVDDQVGQVARLDPAAVSKSTWAPSTAAERIACCAG